MKLLKKNTFTIIILIMSLLQFILIAHRLSFDTNLLFNFYKKDYGIIQSFSISKKFSIVLNINTILRKNDIKNFQLSKLLNNPNISRIIELSYPSKIDNNSKYYFAFKYEIVKKCLLIESLNEINLYECRQ